MARASRLDKFVVVFCKNIRYTNSYMKKHKQGFSHLLILVAIVVLGIVGFAGWRVMTRDDNADTESKASEQASNSAENESKSGVTDEEQLNLKNLGIETFDDMIVSTDALREYDTMGLKGLYVFGDALSGNRLNPNIEYASMKKDAKIIAAVDGEIVFIREQEDSGDSEVFLQTSEDSVWMIGYDHLVGVQVKKGDKVKAGDWLGSPAVQGNGLYRFEFQVNKRDSSGGEDTHYCPFQLLDETESASIKQSFRQLLSNWESTTGKNDLYDEDALGDRVGCYQETLTLAQAEGR